MHRPPMQRVLARVEGVPGYGWAPWAPSTTGKVEVEGTTMTNGIVTVTVDETTGTFALNGVAGLDRLVDDGEAGDTYNYCPPAHDAVIDTPGAVTVRTVEPGPVRGRIEVTRTYHWPSHLDDATGARATTTKPVEVTTTIELHAGESLVRVTTRFDNTCRDHRVRAHFPLPDRATTSHAECAFTVVERGLTAEGGASEQPLPTYPSRRFVKAGGLTVVHEGLLEYELVGEGTTLALTLIRANGWLSRGPMATRPEPAGPMVPLEGPQMQGPVEVRYAVHVGDDNPYELVDAAFLPLVVAIAPGGGTRADTGTALTVEGAQVSAVRRAPGGLEVRVFNPTGEATTVRIEGRRGWLVDLRGRPLAPFEGGFALRAQGIATARLDD
jgi:hypothetical protein